MPSENSSPFRIGTCGYSYPGTPPQGWSGVFYPKSRGGRVDALEFYAAHFDSVEINSTFYRPATPAMATGWVNRTPTDFVFAVKAWHKFTHPKKLGAEADLPKDSWEDFGASDVELFLEGIAPLGDARKLGPLLFQYPASFHRDEKNIERLGRTLHAFEHYAKVVELRHRSWSDHAPLTHDLLTRLNSGWAYIDEPKFATSVEQEFDFPGAIAYLRLHGRNQEKWWRHQNAWERYDYLYRPDSVRRLGGRLKELSAKSPTMKFYVYFNNHARGQAVANALMLRSALAEEGRILAPKALVDVFPELKDFVGAEEGAPVEPG